jgi:uncharacterized protein (TIGR03437 family)
VPLGPTTVTIANKLGVSAPVAVNVTAVAPGVYADGLDQPVPAGGSITILSTGLGANPDLVQVTIGGVPANVTSSGPAPGMPGINRVDAQVPDGLATGPQILFLTIQDIKSNEVQIGVE